MNALEGLIPDIYKAAEEVLNHDMAEFIETSERKEVAALSMAITICEGIGGERSAACASGISLLIKAMDGEKDDLMGMIENRLSEDED